MSATTYNELRNAVKQFTRRNDIDLVFDTMIELAENYIYPKLRVREMFTTHAVVLTAGIRETNLPANFLEAVPKGNYISILGTRYPVEYRIDAVNKHFTTGVPSQFKIADTIEFDVAPDDTYAFFLEHFARPAKLTEALGTNAILTAYPDIYFYAVMWQVREYSVELELADREKGKLDMAIADANHRFKTSQFGPEPRFLGTQFSTVNHVIMRGH